MRVAIGQDIHPRVRFRFRNDVLNARAWVSIIVNRVRKLDSSCRVSQRFDSIAEDSECSDHSRSAGSLSPFTYCGAAFHSERHCAK